MGGVVIAAFPSFFFFFCQFSIAGRYSLSDYDTVVNLDAMPNGSLRNHDTEQTGVIV